MVDWTWMIYSLARATMHARITRRFTEEDEEQFVRSIVSAGETCLDIGAHVGAYTHLFSEAVGPNGRVYSVEPMSSAFKVLSARVRRFRLKNVSCYELALTDHQGTDILLFAGRPGARGTAHLVERSERKQRHELVHVTTLDEWASREKCSKLDFVKVDVEGAEYQIFQGGQLTLQQFHPVILCELGTGSARYGHTPDDVFQLLRRLGYFAFVYQDSRLVGVSQYHPSKYNYVFVPGSLEAAYSRVKNLIVGA